MMCTSIIRQSLFHNTLNRIDGVIFSILVSGAVAGGFENRSSQTKDY